MSGTREAFGPTLRAQREKCGITLEAIAESTKISVSLLAALERGDVSRWPKAIFRRAFFREYALAIGLAPEPWLSEFVRLFPDDPAAAAPDPAGSPDRGAGAPEAPPEFRLTLDDEPRAAARAARRVAIAAAEVAGILLIGAVVAWGWNADIWRTTGVVGLVYYLLMTACVERRLRRPLVAPRLRSGVADWLALPDSTPQDENARSRPAAELPAASQ